jgi:hypothetical protein
VITSIIDEFAFSLPLDNKLLIDDIQNGVPITERDIIDVAINVRSLFVVATLTCRELVRVEDCLELWTETRELIAELLTSWAQVEANDHPQVNWLLTELSHLESLCTDRCELYTITTKERIAHAATRDADIEYSFSQRHEIEPGQTQSCSPPHVYQLGHF